MSRKNGRSGGLLFYIITPLVFALIIGFATYFVAKPVLDPVADLLSLISMSGEEDSGDGEFPRFLDNRELPFGSFEYPASGKKFARLEIEGTSVDCGVYLGDSNNLLKKGVGVSMFSSVPGDNGVTLIAGHCASYFSTLGNAQIGGTIYLDTSYGSFVFKITDIQVRKAADFSESELHNGKNKLILYTCYPFNTLYSVSRRYFVYAERVSGPTIIR